MDFLEPNDKGQCSAVVNYGASIVSKDNCPSVITQSLDPAHSSGSSFPVGNTNVVTQAVDGNSNSALCLMFKLKQRTWNHLHLAIAAS